MKERKALFEDALHATRAALAEGIVPGGGVALLQARKALDKFKLEGDEAARRRRAASASWKCPCRWIAENAGLDGTVVVNNIRTQQGKELRLRRRDETPTATCARPASSIRSR